MQKKGYINIPRPTNLPDYLVKKIAEGNVFVEEKKKIFEDLKNNFDKEKLEYEIGRLKYFLTQCALDIACNCGGSFSWRDDYEAGEELYAEMVAFQKTKF